MDALSRTQSLLGGRWAWSVLSGLVALVAGGVAHWALLQHAGLALLGLPALCLLTTSASALVLTAEGHATARTATAGDRVIVRYTVRNRGIWPVVWTVLRPEGISDLPVDPQIVALMPRGRRRISASLPCPRRGHWRAGGWRLETGDPFGFFGRGRSGGGADTILVYPRPIPLPDVPLPLPRGYGLGTRGPVGAQASVMVREVRPYRPGDPLSRIHWLSSAHHDALMVKEPEGEPSAHAWLVVDLDAAVHHGEAEGDSADLVVGAAAHLAQRYIQARIATGLLLVGPDVSLPPDGGRTQGERMLAALATAQPAPASVDHSLRPLLDDRHSRVWRRHGALIVITSWADDRWSVHLPALARSGWSVLCVLIDTPNGDRADQLEYQAAVLRAAGIRVYCRTMWAA